MDGARFSNALVYLNKQPSEVSWKIGLDCLSLGASKNGAFAAEVIIFFNPRLINNLNYKRLINAGANYIALSSFIWDNPILKPELAIRKFK